MGQEAAYGWEACRPAACLMNPVCKQWAIHDSVQGRRPQHGGAQASHPYPTVLLPHKLRLAHPERRSTATSHAAPVGQPALESTCGAHPAGCRTIALWDACGHAMHNM